MQCMQRLKRQGKREQKPRDAAGNDKWIKQYNR